MDIGSGTDDYSASYDASGNMTARAPSESQPQQKLSWDNEGRLTAWQNAPSNPTSTAQYLYDGEGNRVEQQTTTGGTTTTITYVGNLESVATTGGTTTTTTYYYAAGQRIALAVNGTLSYLASDLLGSATLALDGSGTGLPTASQLYAPVFVLHPQTRQAGLLKTDKRDALGLANLLYAQVEKGVQLGDPLHAVRRLVARTPAAERLRGMVRHRYEVVNETTQRKNKLTAICD